MEYTNNTLKITYNTNEYIIIKFLDNVGANVVYNKLKNKTEYKVSYYGFEKSILPEHFNKSETSLESYFNKISAIGLKHNLSVASQITQSDLNTYHRFFTANAEWLTAAKNNRMEKNPFDPEFLITSIVDEQDFLNTIWNINNEVHRIEEFIDTQTRNYVRENHLYGDRIVMRCMPAAVDGDLWHNFDDIDVQINYLNSDADVVLFAEVQGKTILQAFLDEDDPNQEDISERTGTYGSFVIDLDGKRRELYNSRRFLEWLGEHSMHAKHCPLEYPIGKVVKSTIRRTPRKIIQIQ